MAKDDEVTEGRDAFAKLEAAWGDNAATAKDDLRFALLEDQWPESIRKQREADGRPVLTINKLKAFGKQVINDARQNKPSIKVHPVDDDGDVVIADIYNGLIRNVETTSNADVAYDTATECAVWGGYGFIRISLDYAYEDSFDLDLMIKRVINPFAVYGDAHSVEADSSDWNEAFVVDRLSKKQFESQYADAEPVSWSDSAWTNANGWIDGDDVMVAEWWTREKVDKPIVLFEDLRDGALRVFSKKDFEADEDLQALKVAGALAFRQERTTKGCKVTQRIMSGAQILRRNDWQGSYIPIVPVYGDEFNVDGKRYFRSLIHSAKDSQRSFNFWRTNAAEMVALAPRVPFIGPKGAFSVDKNWQTANLRNHAYLEYDPQAVAKAGGTPPQRQPLDLGAAAGSLQEALNASDDIKATIGMYDASLGARSNETSGKAIMARQREGDVATFHFQDNMVRAIRHTGRILIDLAPKVYGKRRILRVMGEDGTPSMAKMGQPVPQTDPDGVPMMDADGVPITRINDLARGKYDLTVTAGPSFTTRRQEAAYEMTETVRAFPESAPVIVPALAKNLDWPGADEIARKLEALSGPPEVPPEVQQEVDRLTQENQQLKQGEAAQIEKIKSAERISQEEIASKERIAKLQTESDERIAAGKALADAAAAKYRVDNQARIPVNGSPGQ